MTAFALTDEFTGAEPVTFPGFPGAWVPGEPQNAADLVGGAGLDDEQAVADRLRECPHLVEVAAAKGRKAKADEEDG